MKKRIVALLLVLVMVVPAGLASALTWYRVSTTSLKLRYLPSTSAKVLDSFRTDFAMNQLSSTNDGWSYVRVSNGSEGYVQSRYIKKASSYKAWITRDGVALRTGPAGSFSETAILAKGRKVSVLSHGAKYDYVNAGDLGYGYVVNSLLSKKKIPASGTASVSTIVTGGDYYGYVMNAGNQKVNLRSYASANAPVIAKYAPGTRLYVISHSKVWDKVKIKGKTGYMMTKFITTSVPAPTAVPTATPDPKPAVPYWAYVVTANKGSVNVRKGPGQYANAYRAPYGAKVKVLKHTAKWDYIQFQGKKGYVQNKYLQLTKPADAPTITPTPKPTKAPKLPYIAVITSPNGKAVNFHKKPGTWSSNVDGVGRLEVGTYVTVIDYKDDWAQLEYKNKKGWVMKKYLKKP